MLRANNFYTMILNLCISWHGSKSSRKISFTSRETFIKSGSSYLFLIKVSAVSQMSLPTQARQFSLAENGEAVQNLTNNYYTLAISYSGLKQVCLATGSETLDSEYEQDTSYMFASFTGR